VTDGAVEIAGAVVSTTVTENVPLALVPSSPSTTVHVTVVEPNVNVDPEAGAHVIPSGFPAGFVADAL
jgi:hypothetical protein